MEKLRLQLHAFSDEAALRRLAPDSTRAIAVLEIDEHMPFFGAFTDGHFVDCAMREGVQQQVTPRPVPEGFWLEQRVVRHDIFTFDSDGRHEPLTYLTAGDFMQIEYGSGHGKVNTRDRPDIRAALSFIYELDKNAPIVLLWYRED